MILMINLHFNKMKRKQNIWSDKFRNNVQPFLPQLFINDNQGDNFNH